MAIVLRANRSGKGGVKSAPSSCEESSLEAFCFDEVVGLVTFAALDVAFGVGTDDVDIVGGGFCVGGFGGFRVAKWFRWLLQTSLLCFLL